MKGAVVKGFIVIKEIINFNIQVGTVNVPEIEKANILEDNVLEEKVTLFVTVTILCFFVVLTETKIFIFVDITVVKIGRVFILVVVFLIIIWI